MKYFNIGNLSNLKLTNLSKLEEELNVLQKKCKTRLMTTEIIVKQLSLIEKALNVPKKYLEDTTVYIDYYAEDLPKNYKWTAESTQIIAYYKNGWNVMCERQTLKHYTDKYRVVLAEVTKDKIIDLMQRKIEIYM